MSQYTSVLRVNQFNFDDLWDKLSKYPGAFEEIMFFTQFTHSVRSLEVHRETAKIIEPALRRTEAMGIRSGINVLCSMGFFPEILDEEMSGHKKCVNHDGSENSGRLCPIDKENRAYIREQYRIYAELVPGRIYIDDDISSLDCFCPACISRFGQENGYPELDREQLFTFFADPDKKKAIREAWMRFRAERMSELFALIEETVHEVNPEISLGFMSHMSGTDGLDSDTWAEKLQGDLIKTVSWRPGGGVYDEFTPNQVIDKANRIGVQIRYLPEFVDVIESEIENFPYLSLRKSPSFTAFESLIYLACGCTGTAFNICSKEEGVGEEHDRFFRMAQEVSEVGKEFTQALGREKPSGVGFFWNKTTAANSSSAEWNLWENIPVANDIAQAGIPIAYDSEEISVYLLNRTVVSQMTDEELLQCFSKGVLMDCEALTDCNKRGFSELTGFSVTGEYQEDTMERHIAHPFTYPGGYLRNMRQAFGWNHVPSYTIEKQEDTAEYLMENLDLSGKVRGFAGGIFQNRLGGRICVMGMNPFSWYESLARNTMLKNVCRWLSKDELPAYLNSFHRMALWARGDAVCLANISMEDAEAPELLIKTKQESLLVTITKGSRIVCRKTMLATEERDGYRLLRLPEIPITGTALIRSVS